MAHDPEEYDKTVKYLYGLQKHGIKLGLSNTIELMRILGDPHTSFQSIHIAGTNGKGSTATAISSILIENGFKVGLFTSPHLVSFTERIRINNHCISESDVISLASGIRGLISSSDINPTFFEFVTAMAFACFAVNKVEWAVVETGMGGRLDATNVIHPDITIITNISRDHCEFLGNDIADITYEKAGIIKNNVPLITASQIPDVIEQLKKIAAARDAGIHIYGTDYAGSITMLDSRHIAMQYRGYKNYNHLTAPLTGEFQLYNLCTAVRACEILQQKGVHISDASIITGLQNIRMEGRLEWISQEPPIILDSAHNPDAAACLALSIRRIFSNNKIILVTGIMDDKDIEGILKPLFQIAESVIFTKAAYERAASPEKLKQIMSSVQVSFAHVNPVSMRSTETIKEALDLARSLCGKDHIILVTGSFYTAGEVKEVLGCESVLPRLREYC